MQSLVPMFVDDRHPCWYFDVEKAKDKKNYKYRVGCAFAGKKSECVFKATKVEDIEDEKVWNYINGEVFALRMIEMFKEGKTVVQQWIIDGCKP